MRRICDTMRMMKKTMTAFDKQIYQGKPIYITSDKYWDGGITAGDSLKTKAEFYEVAHQMTSFIKRFISHLKEDIYIGQQYCEYNQLYANWSDLRKHELFRIISSMIQKKRIYHCWR